MSFKETGDLVVGALSNALPDQNISDVVARSVELFLKSYRLEVLDNASWLEREGTAKWCLTERSVLGLVLTAQRIAIICEFGVGLKVSLLPDDRFWYLPGRNENGKWITPTQKTLMWWMKSNGFSSAESLEKSLNKPGQLSAVTIRNWINGKTLPDVSTVLGLVDSNLGLGTDETIKKHSLLVMLLTCRLIQKFAGAVVDVLGYRGALRLMTEYMKLMNAYEASEKPKFINFMNQVASRLGCPPEALPVESIVKAHEKVHAEDLMKRLTCLVNQAMQRKSCDFIQAKDFVSESTRIIIKHQSTELIDPIKDNLYAAIQIELTTRLESGCFDIPYVEDQLLRYKNIEKNGVNLKYVRFTVEARLAVLKEEHEKAYDLYVQAFQESRYRGGKMVKQICRELISISCFMFSLASESKSKRGDYWKTAKYLRVWCDMVGVCYDLIDDDDKAFLFKGRKVFENVLIRKGVNSICR